MKHLLSENLSADVKSILKALPLSYFDVSDEQAIKDFRRMV